MQSSPHDSLPYFTAFECGLRYADLRLSAFNPNKQTRFGSRGNGKYVGNVWGSEGICIELEKCIRVRKEGSEGSP